MLSDPKRLFRSAAVAVDRSTNGGRSARYAEDFAHRPARGASPPARRCERRDDAPSLIKRAPDFGENRAASLGGEQLFRGWSFHFAIDNRSRALELRVIEIRNREAARS